MGADNEVREFTVTLSIERAEYERLYRGQATTVVARDSRGITVQFPAQALRAFLNHTGISGTFLIRIDRNNRLLDIRRQDG